MNLDLIDRYELKSEFCDDFIFVYKWTVIGFDPVANVSFSIVLNFSADASMVAK